MKKIHIISYSIIVLLTTAIRCNRNEKNSRDFLKFNDTIKKVEEVISRQNNLMKKLPMTHISNYYFDDSSYLYFNGQKIGKPGYFVPDTSQVLENLSESQRREFIKNASILKRNDISGNHYDALFRTWRYSYLITEDKSFRMYRDIIYADNETPLSDIEQAHTILDKDRNLILLKAFVK